MGEAMEVRMGRLVIDVTDPVQIGLLRQYALEPDAVELTEDDFPGQTEAEARQAMLGAVTDVVLPPSANSHNKRREAFQDLARLPEAVDRLEDHADALLARVSGRRSSFWRWPQEDVLLFSGFGWPTARQSVSVPGGLSHLPDVGYDLYAAVEGLMKKNPLLREEVGSECGGSKVLGFSYDLARIPRELRRPLQEVTGQYSAIAGRLKDFLWVECRGAGCPPEDKIRMPWNYIERITGSYQNHYEYTANCYCFSGDTYLQTEDGGVVTFNDLAAISRDGGELPELASFDTSTQGIIFQQPTMLIDHASVHSSLMYLQVEDGAGEAMTLEVTPEHRLLTQRDGEQEWVRAGDLEDGEVLIGGAGEEFSVDLVSTRIEEGVHTVYNLSFSSAQTGMVPTYLGSADGEHWLVAHNMK